MTPGPLPPIPSAPPPANAPRPQSHSIGAGRGAGGAEAGREADPPRQGRPRQTTKNKWEFLIPGRESWATYVDLEAARHGVGRVGGGRSRRGEEGGGRERRVERGHGFSSGGEVDLDFMSGRLSKSVTSDQASKITL